MNRERLRRVVRTTRDRIIYRLDQLLDQPPIVQVGMVCLLTVLLVASFALLTNWIDPENRMDPFEALWWTVTRFLDGGTMAPDAPSHRGLSLMITATGVLVVALLTAFLSSKMGERLTDLRSGMNAVVEHDHFLCLGYDANVPLLARELSRSGQRCTLVILAAEDKDRIDVALRPAQRTSHGRLRIVVRTGDPRTEQALLRVAAHRARKVLVLPPHALDDDRSVRWALGALLALRRVVGEGWTGKAFVLARHLDAIDLLELATERGVAGRSAFDAEIVAIDAALAGILAQSTREAGVYQVLRHLLAFDGCELYTIPVPRELAGKRFDEIHAAVEGAIVVGVRKNGVLTLCPTAQEATDEARRAGIGHAASLDAVQAHDLLVVMGSSAALHGTRGSLPPTPQLDPTTIPPIRPESISIVGCTATLPHLMRELSASLPKGSRVRLVLGESYERGVTMVQDLKDSAVVFEPDRHTASELAHEGEASICRSDAVVILGQETDDDANGDASALATLLRLRRGIRLCGTHGLRLVTEVRDPRSAAHLAPRTGDCVVSSDVIAMLLAQHLLDASSADIYRELLHPGGAYVSLQPRETYLPPGPHAFGALMSAARDRGEIALGFYPDPRQARDADPERERERLEEGDPMAGAEAWLNPPRETVVPDEEDTRIAVLTRAR